MIYVVPSKICRKFFNNEITSVSPFGNENVTNFEILEISRIFEKSKKKTGPVIYTNIWPLLEIENKNTMNFIKLGENIPTSLGITATLSNKVYKFHYPRKGDVIYPAKNIAYMIFNSILFWNGTFFELFNHSVASSMFGFLSNDGVFENIHFTESFKKNVELKTMLQQKYIEAEKVFFRSGMRIHRDEDKILSEL